ncbi:MAG: peptidoglycan DD-metalloendopeptidase family protein [Gammaproteobacteria bacterium]|nr:peptidoglycan DD-metalloendopeptidase family protein [Gammaproteobacteria bacterium]
MIQTVIAQLGRVCSIFFILLLSGCGTLVHHKVERGETLYSIGWRYGQDYRDVARWNKLRPPYQISEGQWLRVAPPEPQWWEDEYPDRVRKSTAPRAQAPTPAKKISPEKPVQQPAVKTAPLQPVVPADGALAWRWPTATKSRAQIHQHDNRQKKGIDIEGQLGQNIYAASAGKVVYAGGGLVGYGQLIIIKHNGAFLSAYGHNQLLLVKEGETVKSGQMIAKMGQTDDGRSLLYFETRRNGQAVDPLSILPALP